MLGYLENVEHRANMAFRPDHKIALLPGSGASSGQGHGPDLLGASQYLETVFGKKVGLPPRVDFTAERNVQYVCRTAIHEGTSSTSPTTVATAASPLPSQRCA